MPAMFNIKLSGSAVDKLLDLLGQDIADIADGKRQYPNSEEESDQNENLIIAIKAQVIGL